MRDSTASTRTQRLAERGGNRHRRLAIFTAGLGLALLAAAARAEPGVIQQTFLLHPGWNSVYLEVQPDPDDMDSNFAGLPIASVWAWNPPSSINEFVRDPDEGLLDVPGWLGYFPRQVPEHFLTNLFALQANHAYLIKLNGSATVPWNVKGRPALASVTWQADSFNLKGFPVDPANPPSFGAFFAGVSAHAGQPVYALTSDGHWQLISSPFSTPIHSGEAYWVFSSGPSTFRAPLDVTIEFGSAIDYARGLNNTDVVVKNNAPVDADLTFRLLPEAGALPLSYRVVDPDTGEIAFPDLPSPLVLPTASAQDAQVQLGLRRAAMSAERMDAVMQITDGLGTRILLEIGGNTVQPIGATPKQVAGRTRQAPVKDNVTTPFAGLWMADVVLNAVSEGQTAGTVPKPTGKDFPMRVLLHVDGTGHVRLLKAVIEMWEDGTMAPSPENPELLTTVIPGHYALITDDSLLHNFSGAGLRDGEPVGLRISTAAYDFPTQFIDVSGSVSPSGSLTWTLVLASDYPTNPFLHRFHPDHDNLDALFLHPLTEAFAVTRIAHMQFSATDPSGTNPPEWGSSRLGGTYSEEITGLHRNRIFVSGTFILHRIATTSVLNE